MSGSKTLFINNKWIAGTGPAFTSANPATGEVAWTGPSASENDILTAVEAAKQAAHGWASTHIETRKDYLRAFAEILLADRNPLSEAISIETGKPAWESQNEVNAMIGKIDISIEAYGKRCAELIMDQPHARSITRHHPHGIVAVFGPSNFPGHLPNGHIVPALLAGNTVVFKASELTPLVAETTIQLWEKTGLPKGVLNLVQGGHLTGRHLAVHPLINGLFFTGSWNTGKFLSELFAPHPEKILALEMGGNNPLVVSQISNLEAAAYLTIQSAYLTAGQRCTCARRLIVPKGNLGDDFLAKLMAMIKTISVGPYTQAPEPYMGPVITKEAAQRLLAVQESLKKQGGKPLIEMRLLKEGTGLLSPGLMDVTQITSKKDEEYFGPFLQLIRVNNFEEAIQEANKTSFGLSAGLFSDSREEYDEFYHRVKAGIINWNVQLTGASSSAPFGGVGRSGNYRPSAYYAADYCSYPVASMESPSCSLPAKTIPGVLI